MTCDNQAALIRPHDIEWIWIVEEKRNATPEEIRELCEGKTVS
jgi:hypothetical protein